MNKDQSNNPAGRPPIDAEPADHQFQLRVTRERKNAYVRAAKPGKLTAWCLQRLDRAADYQPPES